MSANFRLRWYEDEHENVNMLRKADSLQEPLTLPKDTKIIVESWQELGFVEIKVKIDGASSWKVLCASSFFALSRSFLIAESLRRLSNHTSIL